MGREGEEEREGGERETERQNTGKVPVTKG